MSMKRKKKNAKRLALAKETLATLDPKSLEQVVRGAACGESHVICSVQHSCVSCRQTDTCTDTCA
jgi:hypothetical protein